jgi:hypothetical protein
VHCVGYCLSIIVYLPILQVSVSVLERCMYLYGASGLVMPESYDSSLGTLCIKQPV